MKVLIYFYLPTLLLLFFHLFIFITLNQNNNVIHLYNLGPEENNKFAQKLT